MLLLVDVRSTQQFQSGKVHCFHIIFYQSFCQQDQIGLSAYSSSKRHQTPFFNRVIRIWNSLPYIDMQLPYSSIKKHILNIFWQYFLQSYAIDYPCSWCIACSCANCSNLTNPSYNQATLFLD